jgi:hypothetical protein
VLRDVPVGRGYLDVQLLAAADAGARLRAEAGYHPVEHIGLFAFGEHSLTSGAWMAGAGARLEF